MLINMAMMNGCVGLTLNQVTSSRDASIHGPTRSRRMENNPKLNPGGDGETIEVTDARGAQKTGYMRWVLIISTGLALAAIVVAWFVMRP